MRDNFKTTLLKLSLPLIRPKNNHVALTVHNIPTNQEPWFASTLIHIKEKYGFISPYDFQNGEMLEKPSGSVLLTFDDGFATNKQVAEKILAPLGITAFFFVATGLIGLSSGDARQYAQQNIYPKRDILKADGSTDAMTWNDLRWLNNQGHFIGAHTHSHVFLSDLTLEQQKIEILDSANFLENQLGADINAFAYPFGSLESVDHNSVGIVRERFDFAFSNIRGGLSESPNEHFLFRQNLVPGTPKWMVDAIVEGRLDWRYRKQRKQAHNNLT